MESPHLQNNPMRYAVLFLYYKWGNCSTDGWGHLTNVAMPVSAQARIQIHTRSRVYELSEMKASALPPNENQKNEPEL